MRVVALSVALLLATTAAACSPGSSSGGRTTVRTVVVTKAAASLPRTAPAAGNGAVSASPATGSATPTAPPSWESIFASVSSGVVRIDVVGCYQSAVGTGFLVGPNLVATVAHVVNRTPDIRVTWPSLATATGGTVVGLDAARDLALIHTDTSIPGHIFTLTPQAPGIGAEMASIGFPFPVGSN